MKKPITIASGAMASAISARATHLAPIASIDKALLAAAQPGAASAEDLERTYAGIIIRMASRSR